VSRNHWVTTVLQLQLTEADFGFFGIRCQLTDRSQEARATSSDLPCWESDAASKRPRLMTQQNCAVNSVRRESRRSPVGANPIRPVGRSAGSNQSDEGGNEFVEVLW
jgi:hypothetical protein